MKLSKGKLIAIGASATVVIIVSAIAYNGGGNKNPPVDESFELVEVPEDLTPVEDNSSEDVAEDTGEEVENTATDVIDSKNFVYDPFAEDSGWGNESVFGNKIVVSGTGQRDTSEQEQGGDSIENSTIKNTRELSAAEANAAMMERIKSKDYTYRINENDFSDGFGIYMNPKYEIVVSRIMQDTGYLRAPNDTEVGITELDPSVGLKQYRKEVLTSGGYRKIADFTDEPIFDYGTPVVEGTGIKDFENTRFYNDWHGNDESMSEYGGQLFCDTTAKSTFGSGYYIEMYRAGSSMYYGYYICEHNGRIFKATGMSEYRDTLRDIVLATIDTCVYPY